MAPQTKQATELGELGKLAIATPIDPFTRVYDMYDFGF